MKPYLSGTLPPRDALVVCRNMRWGFIAILLVIWASVAGLWYAEPPAAVRYLALAIALLASKPLIGAWLRRGRPENWVLALDPLGVWINLRDIAYQHAELGDSVVHIPYSEIRSARKFVHRYSTPKGNGGGSVQYKVIYLQLEVADAPVLADLIGLENRRPLPQRKYLRGGITVTTGRTVAPVTAVDDGWINVSFSGGNYALTPRVDKVMPVLERFVRIDAAQEPPRELWQDLDDAKFEALLRRLVASGNRIEATALLRRKRGLSLTEAREAVDQLDRRPADASSTSSMSRLP